MAMKALIFLFCSLILIGLFPLNSSRPQKHLAKKQAAAQRTLQKRLFWGSYRLFDSNKVPQMSAYYADQIKFTSLTRELSALAFVLLGLFFLAMMVLIDFFRPRARTVYLAAAKIPKKDDNPGIEFAIQGPENMKDKKDTHIPGPPIS